MSLGTEPVCFQGWKDHATVIVGIVRWPKLPTQLRTAGHLTLIYDDRLPAAFDNRYNKEDMFMRQILTLACALLCAFAVTAQAQEMTVDGVELPGTIDVAGNELTLNGAGVRSKWFMSLYVGSLYLPQEFDSAQAIVEADQPMAIQLDIISGMINSENMTEATMEGFDNATGGNMEPIQDDIDTFMGLFEAEINEGDQFRITYVPDDGIVGFKNGKRIGTVDGGMDFKKAVFGIWLGEVPAQESVKTAMMGGE